MLTCVFCFRIFISIFNYFIKLKCFERIKISSNEENYKALEIAVNNEHEKDCTTNAIRDYSKHVILIIMYNMNIKLKPTVIARVLGRISANPRELFPPL